MSDDTIRVRNELERGAPTSVETVVGTRLHIVMAEIARRSIRPDEDELWDLVSDHTSWATLDSLKASATSELQTAVPRACRHLPPFDWALLGAEDTFEEGRRRPDAMWRADGPITVAVGDQSWTGSVVIDDYKLGVRPSTGRFEATASQARAYLAAGQAQFGDDLLGVRILLSRAFDGSVLYLPGKPDPVPLRDTPLWFHYRGSLQSRPAAAHGRPDGCRCDRCVAYRQSRPRYGLCGTCGIALPASERCDHCTTTG